MFYFLDQRFVRAVNEFQNVMCAAARYPECVWKLCVHVSILVLRLNRIYCGDDCAVFNVSTLNSCRVKCCAFSFIINVQLLSM